MPCFTSLSTNSLSSGSCKFCNHHIPASFHLPFELLQKNATVVFLIIVYSIPSHSNDVDFLNLSSRNYRINRCVNLGKSANCDWRIVINLAELHDVIQWSALAAQRLHLIKIFCPCPVKNLMRFLIFLDGIPHDVSMVEGKFRQC